MEGEKEILFLRKCPSVLRLARNTTSQHKQNLRSCEHQGKGVGDVRYRWWPDKKCDWTLGLHVTATCTRSTDD